MKAILGLIHADGGSVHILGQNIDEADVRARIGYAARGCRLLPQEERCADCRNDQKLLPPVG